MKRKKETSLIKRFFSFMKEDSWQSLAVFLILALIFIRFVFFPALSLVTGTTLPLVIVESCSMYHHEEGFTEIFANTDIYEENNLQVGHTEKWDFQNGLDKGDVIFVVSPNNIEKGDVVIFSGGASHPIIHRLINDEVPYATKGDNRITNNLQLPSEKQISQNQMIGKAVFRIPYVGWVKLIFFDILRPEKERGFCA